MITSVTIEGFKSFGAPGKPIELGPLNFIVGANASGKTNFVSALKFLKLSLLHGLDHTVNNEFNGCRETRNRILRERGEQKPCCISVHLKNLNRGFTAPDGGVYTLDSSKYKLKADLRSDDDNPSVFSESFEATLIAKDGSNSKYTLERDTGKVIIHDPTNSISPNRTEVVPPQESAHLTIAAGYFGFPALLFRELVTGWTFFNANSEMARLSSRETPGVELGFHATERQVIVTTHNPGFLDYLEPDQLLLCERDPDTTFTELKNASTKESIDIFRRHFSLGELWVQGALGGIPA